MIFSQWDQFKWGDDEEWLLLLVETQDFSKPANNVGMLHYRYKLLVGAGMEMQLKGWTNKQQRR